MCNLTDGFEPLSEKEQMDKFYAELENDPSFVEYMEEKRREWIEDIENHLIYLQDEISKGNDPYEMTHVTDDKEINL
jgi:hypothetical protein